MKFSLLLLVNLILYPTAKAQSTDNQINNRMRGLNRSGVDRIVCYYVHCTGGVRAFNSGDTCNLKSTKYLIWEINHQSFIQKFDDCFSYEKKPIVSSFFSFLTQNLGAIKNEHFEAPEYDDFKDGKNTTMMVLQDHTCQSTFEIHSGKTIAIKEVDEFFTDTKYIDGKFLNKHYYGNRRLMTYKLKTLIDKELS